MGKKGKFQAGEFQVGDMVEMPGVPIPPVKVLEIKACDDSSCPFPGKEVFRFTDPAGLGDDWMHTSEFVKAH